MNSLELSAYRVQEMSRQETESTEGGVFFESLIMLGGIGFWHRAVAGAYMAGYDAGYESVN